MHIYGTIYVFGKKFESFAAIGLIFGGPILHEDTVVEYGRMLSEMQYPVGNRSLAINISFCTICTC